MAADARAGAVRRFQPTARLARVWRTRIARWVRKRQGEDRLPVELTRRRLYILPTRGGVAFAALVFVMLLAGLNYANSLALLLTFVLAAFALVAMQQCHRNLLGLTVVALRAPPVFAQRPALLEITLGQDSTAPRLRLEAGVDDCPSTCADLTGTAPLQAALALGVRSRGLVHIPRVRIATAHPFGLFRAWTWVHAVTELTVYPAPVGPLPLPRHSAQRPGERARGGAGTDEWLGLRPFRDGDSPRRVDWKAYAREAPLLVKEYEHAAAELCLFEFALVPLSGTEAKLSQLARWIVDAEARAERYGLILGSERVAPDTGPEHRHRCLRLLARFDGGAAEGAA